MKPLSALVPAVVLVAVLGSAGATGGCISDPPPATTCPPPEPAAPSCDAELSSLTTPTGCAPTVLECLRKSPDCTATECAPNPAACWPGGECPPSLVAQTKAGTSCLRLDASNATVGCSWGCPSCVSECDGHAVPLAAFVPPSSNNAPAAFFHFVLPTNLPKRGRLGLYARIRGQVNAGGAIVLAVARGNQPVFAAPVVPKTAYSDMVIGVADGPTIDAAPDSVDVLRPSPAKVAVEIDCIVPFVQPLD